MLAATVFFTYSTLIAFTFANLMEIPEKVRKGTLDFDLIKPVDSQFLISVRKFSFDEIGTVIGGVVMLAIGLSMNGHAPTMLQAMAYIALLVCAVLIFYSFQLMMMTLGIWLVRVDNLWVLGEMVYYVARFPIDIFRSPLKLILTYYIPIAVHRDGACAGVVGSGIGALADLCTALGSCVFDDQPTLLEVRRQPLFEREQLNRYSVVHARSNARTKTQAHARGEPARNSIALDDIWFGADAPASRCMVVFAGCQCVSRFLHAAQVTHSPVPCWKRACFCYALL